MTYNFISFNKKSQANIISVILIILLVLAAIVIVWQVIQGTVRGGAEEIETQTDCIGLNIDITKIIIGVPPSSASVTIRPSKDISSYKVYKNGALKVDGGEVTAFSTSTTIIAEGIVVGDVIEVLGKIGVTICPVGAKETAK
ncbi:MAG: hypothetical protein AABW90_02825 [Nanoarchaeota archaeon]